VKNKNLVSGQEVHPVVVDHATESVTVACWVNSCLLMTMTCEQQRCDVVTNSEQSTHLTFASTPSHDPTHSDTCIYAHKMIMATILTQRLNTMALQNR